MAILLINGQGGTLTSVEKTSRKEQDDEQVKVEKKEKGGKVAEDQ